jgi:hypothetical protein
MRQTMPPGDASDKLFRLHGPGGRRAREHQSAVAGQDLAGLYDLLVRRLALVAIAADALGAGLDAHRRREQPAWRNSVTRRSSTMPGYE